VVWDVGGVGSWLSRQSVAYQYTAEWIAHLGLELGAMSHSLSDWGGSAYKRFQKQGLPVAK